MTSKGKPCGITAVLIDVGKNMSEEYEDGKSYFEAARETADWIFSRKIFAAATEKMMAVTYGSENTINPFDYKGIHIHNEDLVMASFDHLRFINNEITINSKQFGNLFHGLKVCIDVLNKYTEENESHVNDQTIVLITNGMNQNIKPEQLDLIEEKLREYQIDLIIIGINREKEIRSPVSSIVSLADNTSGQVFSFEDMLKVVSNFIPKQVESRNMYKQWEIAPGLRLPLSFTTKVGKVPNHLKFSYIDDYGSNVVRVNQLTVKNENGEEQSFMQPPKTVMKNLDESKAQKTKKEEFNDGCEFGEKFKIERSTEETCSGYYFGKTLIFFDSDEIKRQYNDHKFNDGEKGGCLKLIQFTNISNINPTYLFGDKSYTVLPTISKTVTSRTLDIVRCTVSLIEAMLDLEVAAICRYAYSASSHLQLIALIAHRDENTGVSFLRGLRLPFADDMKTLHFPKLDKLDDDHKNRSDDFDTIPSMAQLSAIDDLIDSMQFDDSTAEWYNSGSIPDPQLQLQCHFLKSKVLNPQEERAERHLQYAEKIMESLLQPKKEALKNNSEIFERLQRQFNLTKMEKQKRSDTQLEKMDMKPIIDEWRNRKSLEKPDIKKKKVEKDSKEELVQKFERNPKNAAIDACENSLKAITGLCMLPDNISRNRFFDIVLEDLLQIRHLCISYKIFQPFNELLTKLRNEEDYQPFTEYMGENGKHCGIINNCDVPESDRNLEETLEFWEESDILS